MLRIFVAGILAPVTAVVLALAAWALSAGELQPIFPRFDEFVLLMTVLGFGGVLVAIWLPRIAAGMFAIGGLFWIWGCVVLAMERPTDFVVIILMIVPPLFFALATMGALRRARLRRTTAP